MLTKSFLLLHQLIKLRLLYTIMTPSTSLCERYHLIINQLVYFDIDYHSDISFFFTIKCKNTWAWYWLFKHSPDCQVLLRGTCGLVNGGGSTGAMSSDGSRKLLSGLAMARVRWCLGLEAPGLWEAMGESVVEVKIGKVTWSWIQDSTLVPLLALKNVAGLLLRILMASTLGWWQTLALACSQSLRHPSSHHLASMCDHLDHLTQCHHLDQLTLGRLRDLVPLPVVQRIQGPSTRPRTPPRRAEDEAAEARAAQKAKAAPPGLSAKWITWCVFHFEVSMMERKSKWTYWTSQKSPRFAWDKKRAMWPSSHCYSVTIPWHSPLKSITFSLNWGSGNMPVNIFTTDIVKGWTRATCVAWILLAFSELDTELEDTRARLKPVERFLDRAWLIPQNAPKRCWNLF